MHSTQKIFKGPGSLQVALTSKEVNSCRRMLLVTGAGSGKNLPVILSNSNLYREEMITPAGILQVRDIPVVNNTDLVVAIGGGRVLDFAKAVINKNQLFDCILLAAPTTAGSGSEATHFAVVFDGLEKISIEDPRLLPQIVVLDPELLRSLPSGQRAISAADAFCQAVESAWSNNSNEESQARSLAAISAIKEIIAAHVFKKDMDIDLRMMEAAYLAGSAIAGTRTTGPHALSYYLTSRYNLPHGQAVSLFLPLFFLYNAEASLPVMEKIYLLLGVTDAEAAALFCRELFEKIGLATTFKECGLNDIRIEELIFSVNHQRFLNNPVSFDPEKLEFLIRKYII